MAEGVHHTVVDSSAGAVAMAASDVKNGIAESTLPCGSAEAEEVRRKAAASTFFVDGDMSVGWSVYAFVMEYCWKLEVVAYVGLLKLSRVCLLGLCIDCVMMREKKHGHSRSINRQSVQPSDLLYLDGRYRQDDILIARKA